jgi:protein-S-isoprenylcysteine O-methyltransferase Ste14
MDVVIVAVFVLVTIANCAFTWQFSIKKRRFHGIPRFFAFESILLLILLNYPVWFVNPLSWNQILSWILLIASIPFAIAGFYLLRIIGKPKGDFENTSKLVVVGLYRLIRHPLYTSLILLGLGIFFKEITVTTLVLAFINILTLIATAKLEEQEMLNKFGNEYANYMKKSKMFIPFVI